MEIFSFSSETESTYLHPFWTNQTLASYQWHYVGASYHYTTVRIASAWVNGVKAVQTNNIGAGITSELMSKQTIPVI